MTNREIADLFDRIAEMLALKGESVFRTISYKNAAESIREQARDLRAIAADGGLESIPHVGKIIADKITEILETGALDFYNRLADEIPPGVLDILHVNGVGPKKAILFWQTSGIVTLDTLEAAARDGKLRDLPGMGAKSEAKILEGIESLRRRAANTRMRIDVALTTAESLLARLLLLPGSLKGEIAGSIRRGRPTIGDLDLLVASTEPQPIMDAFVGSAEVARVLGHGDSKSSVELHNGLQVDVRVIAPERWGTALQYFSGSQAHNVHLRQIALEQGLSLNEHALTPVNKNGEPTGADPILCAEEADVYERLGLPWIPPELREDQGEIEAALAHRLPSLITLDDIHADLHMHTTWSDGTASIREMVEAARARGRAWIVITDHSESGAIGKDMSAARLMQQQDEVRRLDAECAPAMRLFHGSEVEIRADGSLDYPDELLAQLDFVIASLHKSLDQPREQITSRLIKAIANPHIDLIAHPRGQIILGRDGADLDMERVFEAAVTSGVALEINANPHRLDLEAKYARRACELGIPITIDTDAHAPSEMDNMRYGIMTARRGWLSAAHVLNAGSIDRFIAHTKRREG
ncbi:MAG: DNA polymerase/3'-5' exonuclease PolX [Chloroflexota bacterium]|nr:DNA polymerase/3'-5' exonuclease PolX [Chloroflexota bacterium]